MEKVLLHVRQTYTMSKGELDAKITKEKEELVQSPWNQEEHDRLKTERRYDCGVMTKQIIHSILRIIQ